mgnify:CR=1 FL=1
MPILSSKSQAMPASPIRKLVPYAEGAKKRGTKVYHLNIGQPDIETPISARDAIHVSDIPVLAYSHSAGQESLRKGFIDYYNKLGFNLNLSNIIVTTGGSEALLFAFGSIMDDGDEVIIPAYTYAATALAVIHVGATPIMVDVEDDFNISLKSIENAITDKTKAVLPVDIAGWPCDYDELNTLVESKKYHDEEVAEKGAPKKV